MKNNTQTNLLEYEKMNIPKTTENGYQDVIDSMMPEIEKIVNGQSSPLEHDFFKMQKWNIGIKDIDVTKFWSYEEYLFHITKLPRGNGQYTTHECSWFSIWTNQWAGRCSYTIPKEWKYIDSKSGVSGGKKTYTTIYEVPDGTYILHEQWNTPTSQCWSEDYEEDSIVRFHNGYELQIQNEENFKKLTLQLKLEKEGILVLKEKLQAYENLWFCTQINGNGRFYTNMSTYWDNFEDDFNSIKKNTAKELWKERYSIKTPILDNYYYDNLCGKIHEKSLMPIYHQEKEGTTPIMIWDQTVYIDLSKILYIKRWEWEHIDFDYDIKYEEYLRNFEIDDKITIVRRKPQEYYSDTYIPLSQYNNNNWENIIFTNKALHTLLSYKYIESFIHDDDESDDIIKIIEWNASRGKQERHNIKNSFFEKYGREKTEKGTSHFFIFKWVGTITLDSETLEEFRKFMQVYGILWDNTIKTIERLWYELVSNLSERLLSKMLGYTEKHIPSFLFQLDNKKFLWKTSRWWYSWEDKLLESREDRWIVFIDHDWYNGKNNQLLIIRNQLDPTHSTIITRSLIRSIKTENVLDIVENLNKELQEWVNLQNELNCGYRPEEDEIN